MIYKQSVLMKNLGPYQLPFQPHYLDLFSIPLQSWVDEKTPWTTRYGSIAGLAELGHDVRPQGKHWGEGGIMKS